MAFEIDFLQAGDSNGDAICIRYDTAPGYFRVHVVDGGFVDTGDMIIDHIESHYQPIARYRILVDHMVLSHMDDDHAGGLLKVMQRFEVRNLWMNRPWLYVGGLADFFHPNFTDTGLVRRIRDMNPNMVALERLAQARGIPIRPAFQGTQIGSFTVLAPSLSRFIGLIPNMGRTPQAHRASPLINSPLGALRNSPASPFDIAETLLRNPMETWQIETLSQNPDPTSASNESSIVQIANLNGHRALLTADAGPDALQEAVDYAVTNNLQGPLDCVQVPHHGSRHNVTPAVLDRLLGPRLSDPSKRRGSAYASIGSEADDYPRKSVSNAFLRRGYPVFSTRNGTMRYCEGILSPGWSPAQEEPFSYHVEGLT